MSNADWKEWVALVSSGSLVATGYPIAPDRVLTSLHAVQSGGAEVCFFRQDRERTYTARVIWPAEGAAKEVTDLDVAVLKLDEAVATCLLAPGPQLDLVTGEPWETEGFPAVSFKKGDDGLELEPLMGTLHSLTVGTSTLKLDLTSFPELPEGWKGFSGAPVVVGRRLVGVVRELPRGWRGRVEATSLAAVWQAPGFLDSIGDRGIQLLRERFEQELEERLVRYLCHDWLRQALCNELDWPPGTAEQVKTKLLEASALDVAMALRNVHFRIENGLLAGDLQTVRAFACTALPQLDEALAGVTSAIRQLGSDCLSLTIETLPVAELVMARLDGRPARFELRGTGMVGTALLDLAGEAGIDAQSFHQLFRYALARAIGLRANPDQVAEGAQLDRRIRAKLRALAHEREPDRITYYCAVSHDRTKLLAEPKLRFWVAETYPQLRLLELTGQDDRELDLVAWLEKIVLAPEKGSS